MKLILSPRVTPDADKLQAAAQARGWKTERLRSWRVDVAPGNGLVLYGEPLFCRVVAAQTRHVLLEPPHAWLETLEHELLGRKVAVQSFRDLPSLDYPLFIKPPDDKIFPAKVYSAPDELLRRDDIGGDQLVLISEPVAFEREYRAHILNGAVVSLSLYCERGELAVAGPADEIREAKEFANRVAGLVRSTSPPAYVIDVGILDTGAWAVVEANPAFGAGIYSGDPSRILDVLRACCVAEKELGPESARFVFRVELEK